jgi:hypothetical protein
MSTWIQLNLKEKEGAPKFKEVFPPIWLNLDNVRFIIGDSDGSLIYYTFGSSAAATWQSGLYEAMAGPKDRSESIMVKESREEIFEKAKGSSAVKF